MSKQNFRRGNKELIGGKRRWKINLETGWSISPAAVATHPVFIQRRERHLDEIQTNHQYIPGVGGWPFTEQDTPRLSLNCTLEVHEDVTENGPSACSLPHLLLAQTERITY